MKRTNLNRGWTLQKGEPPRIPMMPVQTKPVDLPHDFMVEGNVNPNSKNGATSGYYDGGVYTYTKQLEVPTEWEGQRVLVYFDGVFGKTKVILNGHVMGSHRYGYTPFAVELTDLLQYGSTNRLSVTVSNDDEPNSRWYSGGGIYRDVTLLTAPMVHIAPDGLYLYIDHILNGDAFVVAQAEVENHSAKPFCGWVSFKIGDAEGRIRVYVAAGQKVSCRTQLCLENANIWDIDNPYVYDVDATLLGEDGGPMDTAQTIFGVRTVSVDAKNGFVLNGRTVKLKGGCLHHDNGILGAASFYEAEYRKLKRHKENGYNAVRCAHDPASATFLEACDRLGILVIEEAFDCWNMAKNQYDYSNIFALEWRTELEAFMRRDRNHPSIVLWSIGNELPEQGGLSDGYRTSYELAQAARAMDATRPICGALCSFFSGLDDFDTVKFWQSMMEDPSVLTGGMSNLDSKYGKALWPGKTEAFCAPWDVVGYNYLAYQYEVTGERFPNRVICSTESKPAEMEAYWRAVEKYPYLIGDFVWTSMDYIGEAGIGKQLYVEKDQAAAVAQTIHAAPYPWRTSGCGDFDLCGNARAQLAYRKTVWGGKETYIAVHDPRNHDKVELLGRYAWPDCTDSWNWPVAEGSPVTVEVYSAAPEVELLLNGQSLGRKATAHNKAAFEVPYTRGDLMAVSYDGNLEISRSTVVSGGEAEKVRLKADGFGPNGICFVELELTDGAGVLAPYAESELSVEVEGAALLALGSARPQTEENYTTGTIRAYHGRALAVLRAPEADGEATLRIKATGLADTEVKINIG